MLEKLANFKFSCFYTTVTLCKKKEEKTALLLKLEKLHFDPISNPSLRLVQTSQSKVFPPKKLIQVNFKSSQYCNFVLKIRNALSVNFS